MSDEQAQESTPRSLMDRIAQAFGSEPRDEAELLEILRSATERKIVDPDALAMIEGVFEVAGMQVRDRLPSRLRLGPFSTKIFDIIFYFLEVSANFSVFTNIYQQFDTR